MNLFRQLDERLDRWLCRFEGLLEPDDQPEPVELGADNEQDRPSDRANPWRRPAYRPVPDRWHPTEYVDPDLERLRKKRWEAEVDRQFRICVRVMLTVSGFVVGSSTSWDVLIVITLAAVAFLARYPELI
jgi:hypothetical protein